MPDDVTEIGRSPVEPDATSAETEAACEEIKEYVRKKARAGKIQVSGLSKQVEFSAASGVQWINWYQRTGGIR